MFHLCDLIDAKPAQAARQGLGLHAEGGEWRSDHKDSNSLQDAAVLAPFLEALLEEHQSPAETAEQVMGLLRRAEFKRRQAPPVLKLSQRAFGSGWRMPIAAKS